MHPLTVSERLGLIDAWSRVPLSVLIREIARQVAAYHHDRRDPACPSELLGLARDVLRCLVVAWRNRTGAAIFAHRSLPLAVALGPDAWPDMVFIPTGSSYGVRDRDRSLWGRPEPSVN